MIPRVVERVDTFAGESESTLDEDLEGNAAVERRERTEEATIIFRIVR